MPDIYLIGAIIRFTALIKDMEGEITEPASITVTVFSADGTKLLDKATPTNITEETEYNYFYDWKVTGITVNTQLIVVWDYDDDKKRMKFKVLLETD